MTDPVIEAHTPVWLTREQVAQRLQLEKSTLAYWAVKGLGPRFAKFGRHVRYSVADLSEWEQQQIVGGQA